MHKTSSPAEADLDWAGIPELIMLFRNTQDFNLRLSLVDVWRHPRWRRVLLAGLVVLVAGLVPPAPWVVIPLGYGLVLVAWIQGCEYIRQSIERPILYLSPTPEPESRQIQLIKLTRRSKVRIPSFILGFLCLYLSITRQVGSGVNSLAFLLFLACLSLVAISFRSSQYHFITYHGNLVPWRHIEPAVKAVKKIRRRGYVLHEAIPRAIDVESVLMTAPRTNDIVRIRLLEWSTLAFVRGRRITEIGRRLRKPMATIATTILLPVIGAIIGKLTHLS